MKKPNKSAAAVTATAGEPPPPANHDPMEEADTFFTPNSDLCQQLLDRYSASSAIHHRHLLATAAAMRSILLEDSLPLSPLSYFAATIDATSQSSSDAASIAALTTFLSLVLPLVPSGSIAPGKAVEALEILVRVLDRPPEVVTTSSAKCLVKCLGVLVGFCDSSDWNSMKLPVETLIKFSLDKRPKVRKCAQLCLESTLKSFQSPSVLKKASKSVLSLLRSHMPLMVKLGSLEATNGGKVEALSEPDNFEALHVLNILKIAIPHLSGSTSVDVVLELLTLLNSQPSALTKPIIETIEAFIRSFGAEITSPIAENTICALSTLKDYPKDTIVSGVTLLSTALNVLHSEQPVVWIKHLPLVVRVIAGVLTLENGNDTASQISGILKQLIYGAMDEIAVASTKPKPVENEVTSDMKSHAITSICSVFNNSLISSTRTPNEYILSVLSVLFLKLGVNSYDYLQEIILKLADFMRLNSKTPEKSHLQKCIGCAIAAMGPENILKLIPISLDMEKFSCSNMWLLPILKNYTFGASLAFFMEFIVPLADSMDRASREVKKSKIAKGLQTHARGLWGLLPAFCRYPDDLVPEFNSLAKLLVTQLEKDSYTHEDIVIALQELVKQNTSLCRPNEDAGEPEKELNSLPLEDSLLAMKSLPSYTKKVANKNIKALATGSKDLLSALTDLFLNSSAEKRTYLKDAMRCLVSISGAVITRKIFISSLEKFEMVTPSFTAGDVKSTEASLDKMSFHAGNDVSQGCLILELASSIIKGADEDLVGFIFRFIKHIFQDGNVIVLPQAYDTLSQMLEQHSSFCSMQFDEVVDMLLGLKVSDDSNMLQSRLTSFHVLLVHALKNNSDEEYTKAFLILNEIIISMKDSKEETRKAAYDVLLKISSSLFDSSGVDPEGPYYKLIKMMMGYTSGSSPYITSGAVSALSMLVYKEPKVSLSIPELVPAITTLLSGKSVEVVKSALGFIKVLVSCLETNDLHGLLSEILDGILPWSPISRHHFRSKVIVILEIMIRKCGPGAIESITPAQYRSFLRKVLQNRHGKNNSKETESDDVEKQVPDSSSNGQMKRAQKDTGGVKENGSVLHKKRGRFGKTSSFPQKPGKEQNGHGGFNKRKRNWEQDSNKPQMKKFKQTRGDQKGQKHSSSPAAGPKRGNHQNSARKFQRNK